MKASRVILHRRHLPQPNRDQEDHKILIPGWILLGLGLLTLSALILLFAAVSRSFPSLDPFERAFTAKPEPTQFFDRSGKKLLFTLAYDGEPARDLTICPRDGKGCFPKFFLDAVRAAISEDELIRRMTEAVYGKAFEASPLPALSRKVLSAQIRQRYSYEELLIRWLNYAWFGQMSFGLDQAARIYLNKGGDKINRAESILLSAILLNPTLNPIDSKGAVKETYTKQLQLLQSAGLISEEESAALADENFVIFSPPDYADGKRIDLILRKALDTAMHELGQEQVERGGFRVITTMDASLQQALYCYAGAESGSVCPASSIPEELQRALNSAAISAALIDNRSGELLAALEVSGPQGSRRIPRTAFRAYPFGTNLNLFAGLSAFSQGFSPASLFWDLPDSPLPDSLQDPERTAHGPVLLRAALNEDYPAPLLQLSEEIGVRSIREQAALFGIDLPSGVNAAEDLWNETRGTAEELAFAFQPFANGGRQNGSAASGTFRPVSVLSIEGSSGFRIEPQPQESRSLTTEGLAYLVHHVFSGQTSAFDRVNRPAAVKTGRIFGEDERWVSGYTPLFSCSVHVDGAGKDNEEAAAALWSAILRRASIGKTISGWEQPEEVSRVQVCLPSGKLPTRDCQETAAEVFLKGNEPAEYDDLYVSKVLNRSNHLLATRLTPQSQREEKVFLSVPPEAAKWAQENGIEQIPSEYDSVQLSEESPFEILAPEQFTAFSRETNDAIDVDVNFYALDAVSTFQVSSGDGMFPENWREMCSGGALDSGKWKLCTLQAEDFAPGLHCLRVLVTDAARRVYSFERYIVIQ